MKKYYLPTHTFKPVLRERISDIVETGSLKFFKSSTNRTPADNENPEIMQLLSRAAKHTIHP